MGERSQIRGGPRSPPRPALEKRAVEEANVSTGREWGDKGRHHEVEIRRFKNRFWY